MPCLIFWVDTHSNRADYSSRLDLSPPSWYLPFAVSAMVTFIARLSKDQFELKFDRKGLDEKLIGGADHYAIMPDGYPGLSVRPVVRLIITYMTSRRIRR